MDIVIIYVIFFVLILLYIIIDYRNNKIKNMLNIDNLYLKKINQNINMNKYENIKKYKNMNMENLSELENVNDCKVPTLSTGQCFKSRFFPCDPKNGSFEQCTNNIMPTNFNALCENRAFELAKPEHKVSENCAYYYGLN